MNSLTGVGLLGRIPTRELAQENNNMLAGTMKEMATKIAIRPY